ncbi:MAG: hypothetical protein GY913_18580 [Proteobacteria bacterium]|nr:hypothetical protein [Pseudomonadota bacterium]MCP4918917.1 hypothetical protein [Pseudomonadota bacterium]
MWLLIGCTPYPDSIPTDPGTFAQEDLAAIWRAAAPGTLSALYSGLARGTFADETTPCPVQSKNDAGLFYEGNGCTDRWGTTWNGSMTVLERDGFADLDAFGPSFDDWRGSQDWTADGRIYWTTDGSAAEVELEVLLAFDGLEHWIDGTGRVSAGSELANRTGLIGVEGWGTATIEHESVTLAGANGCVVPSDGSVELVGASTVVVELPAAADCKAPDPFTAAPDVCLSFGDAGELCDFSQVPEIPQSVDDPTGG